MRYDLLRVLILCSYVSGGTYLYVLTTIEYCDISSGIFITSILHPRTNTEAVSKRVICRMNNIPVYRLHWNNALS